MIKEIKYTGFSASPSDYECPDGDLAAVLNVVPEEGSLSPVMPPRTLFQLDDGGNVRFVHETAYIKNYIILYPDNIITWRSDKYPEPFSFGTLDHDFTGRTIHQINAIGNTLIVLADDGMHYFLWKGYYSRPPQKEDDPKEYRYLGTHYPEIDLSFGLNLPSMYSGTYGQLPLIYTRESNPPRIVSAEEVVQFSAFSNDVKEQFEKKDATEIRFQAYGENTIDTLRKAIQGAANKVINEASKLNLFTMPFLVRYSYRLYDGSIVMHSAPVLMQCCSGCTPLTHCRKRDGGSMSVIAEALGFQLDYCVTSELEKLEQWKDIIKSVDIFVSKPIFDYNENANDWGSPQSDNWKAVNEDSPDFDDFINKSSFCVSNDHELGTSMPGSILTYKYEKREYFTALHGSKGHITWSSDYFFKMPERPQAEVDEEIKTCSNFYLLKSIPLRDLKTERTIITVEKEYLSSLLGRELMTDDYNSHDVIIPKYSYGFNGRLNVTNLRKQLFGGYNASTLFGYTDGYDLLDETCNVEVYFYLKQDNNEFVVKGESGKYGIRSVFSYLFYPSPYAYKAVIAISGKGIYEVKMMPHETLNGSIWFSGLSGSIESEKTVSSVPSVTPVGERIIELPNKIYSSEINNPFYFPLSGISTVGTGQIITLSTAAKALSQGQFGQFPLYAFTDEGVWALQISSSGTVSAVHPFTRDVCINPESITQLDSSVLFAADRGIMLLSGSTSMCISDNLNYDQVFDIESLASSGSIITLAGLDKESFSYVAFREFLLGCRMLYDYVHQRIIVYSRHLDGDGKPECPYPYAYVYSLKTKTWGMIPSNIKDTVPSYPESLAMLFDGSLADYSADGSLTLDEDGSITGIKGMLITRPLKLDAPDALKTVSTVIQRGNFRRGHVSSVLWGSRDLFHWQLVWSSTTHTMSGFRGTPFKYFRIGVLLDLKQDESLYGCSIEYTPRFTNRLR